MEATEIMRAEDMNQEQLADYIIEMLHRMMVHHTLWFREVEHQMGFENALKAMDYAWSRTKKISVKRLAAESQTRIEHKKSPRLVGETFLLC